MATDGIQTPHPFDKAYGFMRSMQAELGELRAALQAEQEQRTKEVGELRREVADLRKALDREAAAYNQAYERVHCALISETHLRGKSIEKVRGEVNEAIRQGAEVENLKAQQATQFGKLATELKAEKRERQTGLANLDVRLGAELAERTAECNKLAAGLLEYRQGTESSLFEYRECITQMAANLQRAGMFLSDGFCDNDPKKHEEMMSTVVGKYQFSSTMNTTAGSGVNLMNSSGAASMMSDTGIQAPLS